MSVRQLAIVWTLHLEHSKLLILLALSDHAHDDGTRCYPGVSYLMWKTGYSRRQVQRILSNLIDDGLIEPVAYRQGGRGFSTEFTLHLEKGVKKTPFRKGVILDEERASFTTRKGVIAMTPQPLYNRQEVKPRDVPTSPIDTEQVSINTPIWFEPLKNLHGYKNRKSQQGTIAKIEQACGEAGVGPEPVVTLFCEYYKANRALRGWSDPVAAFRRTLDKSIAAVLRGTKSQQKPRKEAGNSESYADDVLSVEYRREYGMLPTDEQLAKYKREKEMKNAKEEIPQRL